jgi:hypothetical protein
VAPPLQDRYVNASDAAKVVYPDGNPDQPPEEFGPPIRRKTINKSIASKDSHEAFWKQEWSNYWSDFQYSRRVLAINATQMTLALDLALIAQ